MDNIDKINLRLEKLREYVAVLDGLKGVTAEDLMKDINKKAVAERFLQLAIEACVDIAEIIIVDQRLPSPADSADAIRILGKHGIVDLGFSDDLAKAVGFRNILVHDYVAIDYAMVAEKINNKLSDFDRFSREIAKFLTS